MATPTSAFLDTSALFAAVWSEKGGARAILDLGEARLVDLVISSQVLTEIESALRRKAPAALGPLTLLLDTARVRVAPSPAAEQVASARELVAHPGDACVLAGALGVETDYFVTLDRKHFLDNATLVAAVPFAVVTPGAFLEKIRRSLI